MCKISSKFSKTIDPCNVELLLQKHQPGTVLSWSPDVHIS